MKKEGRPSELNDELRLKIKQELTDLKERPTMARISELTGVEYTTVKNWVYRNYLGFAEFLDGLRRDWKLAQAQENIEEFLTMETTNTGVTKKGDTFEFNDAKLLKIKADTSLFVSETLGKKHYSKRTEVTGKDGESIAKSPMFEDDTIMNKVNEIEKLIKDKLYAKQNKESD